MAHSPQPLQTFPSHHSSWCLQDWHSAAVGMYRILYKLSPLILWMPQLTGCSWVQAEHTFNSHTHLGGLWDTKGTLTMTMNFCTWETGAEELQVTGLKGVLVKRQTKHTSTEPESLNTLLRWATTSGPNCSATEDTKIRNSTLCSTAVSANVTFRATSDCAPRVVTQEITQSRRNSHLEASRQTPCCRWSDLHSCGQSITKLNIPTLRISNRVILSSSIILMQKVTLQWLYAGSDQPGYFFP